MDDNDQPTQPAADGERGASLVRRVWSGLTGARPEPQSDLDDQPELEPDPAERGRSGYTLRQRYWVSLTGRHLPVRRKPGATNDR